MQKWKTAISNTKDGDIYVRGERLLDLIGKVSFTEAIFLTVKGEMPAKNQAALLDIILVSAINHGLEAPSAFVPRVIASTGNSVNAALAAGVLSVGDYHGGAVEECMRLLTSNKTASEIVKNAILKKERLPGYGHKVYKDADPRTKQIVGAMVDFKVKSRFVDLALDIEREIDEQMGKKLPLNIDGIMAAVLSELGFSPVQGKAFFALARIPTMMANIEEELTNEKPYRRLEVEDIEYAPKPKEQP